MKSYLCTCVRRFLFPCNILVKQLHQGRTLHSDITKILHYFATKPLQLLEKRWRPWGRGVLLQLGFFAMPLRWMLYAELRHSKIRIRAKLNPTVNISPLMNLQCPLFVSVLHVLAKQPEQRHKWYLGITKMALLNLANTKKGTEGLVIAGFNSLKNFENI